MAMQQNSSQNSLFGDVMIADVTTPTLAICEPWSTWSCFTKKKKCLGFTFQVIRLIISVRDEQFCPNKISQLKELEKYKDKELTVGGMITAVNHRVSKTGKPFGISPLKILMIPSNCLIRTGLCKL